MFEFRPNYRMRAERAYTQKKRRAELKKEIGSARTLKKLKKALLTALEEGEL